ncbi:MAG: ATP-dependent zinc protease [Betaproteobacteria bacterium]|nr:ATP-dependent zinc protease [Betaproteobacteria bacterium]
MRNGNPLRYLAIGALAWLSQPAVAEPALVGWIEPVKLSREGVVVPAKLDTGADTSSLHASNITWIRRQDGDWVAFDVEGKDNRSVRLERKVQRVTRVKKAAGGVQDRPVVLLGVCLGNTYRVTEVNLTDRTGFKLPFLVGRNFLAERFAVDSSRRETSEPACTMTVAGSSISG